MKRLLKNSGFQSFLWTQFFGALNDNLYKTIVSLRAVQAAASAGLDYLSLAGAVFVLPFLLFGVMMIVNRSYTEVLFEHVPLLIATGVSMGIGALWIRKIVNVEA